MTLLVCRVVCRLRIIDVHRGTSDTGETQVSPIGSLNWVRNYFSPSFRARGPRVHAAVRRDIVRARVLGDGQIPGMRWISDSYDVFART